MSAQVFSISQAATLPSTTSRQLWKCNANTAAFTVTLPDATLCQGAEITGLKTDASVNAVTISRSGTQTILGTGGAAQTTLSLASIGKAFTLVSDGSNWIVTSAV